MNQTTRSISTAFWTYVLPMTSARAMRVGLLLFVLFALVVLALFASGRFASSFMVESLEGLRHFLIMVAVPVGAVLLSEMPIRDGITHRTLLYPLLGPVPREVIAAVRLIVTGSILAVGVGLLMLLVRFLLQDEYGSLWRELVAIALGSFAYVSLFGMIHLYTRRGLITGLAILFIVDVPLGKVPFSLRNLSPSYHVGVIAEQQDNFQLPVVVGLPEVSLAQSVVVLAVIAVALGAWIAYGFRRQNLGELC